MGSHAAQHRQLTRSRPLLPERPPCGKYLLWPTSPAGRRQYFPFGRTVIWVRHRRQTGSGHGWGQFILPAPSRELCHFRPRRRTSHAYDAADPSGRFVLVTDLALDKIFIWKFDVQNGTLTAMIPRRSRCLRGTGRVILFSPMNSECTRCKNKAPRWYCFDFDSTSGRLTARQTVSTLPQGLHRTSFAFGD